MPEFMAENVVRICLHAIYVLHTRNLQQRKCNTLLQFTNKERMNITLNKGKFRILDTGFSQKNVVRTSFRTYLTNSTAYGAGNCLE